MGMNSLTNRVCHYGQMIMMIKVIILDSRKSEMIGGESFEGEWGEVEFATPVNLGVVDQIKFYNKPIIKQKAAAMLWQSFLFLCSNAFLFYFICMLLRLGCLEAS